MKTCKQCNGSGRLPGDTKILSVIPGVCVAYRVLSWLRCHACHGLGRGATK